MSGGLRHGGLWRRMAAGAAAFAALLAMFALQGGSCGRGGGLPAPGTKDYGDAIRAFYVGAAAMQVGDVRRALAELTAASKLAPEEPAVWANLGLMALRANQLDTAGADIEKARALAPNDSRILMLVALLENRRGKFAEAIADYRRVLELDPKNLRARYALVQQVQQQGGPESDAEAQKLLEGIVAEHPDNLVAEVELARLAAKRGDAATVKAATARLAEKAPHWHADSQKFLADLNAAVARGDMRQAAISAQFLNNVLKQEPAYHPSFVALSAPPEEVGEPLLRLVKLPNPPPTPAPPDEALKFAPPAPEPGAAQAGKDGKAAFVTAVYLTQDANPALVWADGHTVHAGSASLPFPGGGAGAPPSAHALAAVDLDGDFKTDLAAAGAGGLKLYKQVASGSFADVTAQAKLPASVTAAPLYGVWAADVDLDGDLDLIVAPERGPLVVLQNDNDGTFKPIQPFGTVANARDFGWADLDGDGVPDAVVLDAKGALRVFANARAGRFVERPVPADLGPVAAIAISDANDDGALDVVALKQDGALVRLSDDGTGKGWTTAELGRWAGASAGMTPETTRLLAGDLDNNGAVDLVASTPTGGQAWLHSGVGQFKSLAAPAPANVFALADMTGTGRLDLVGIGADGAPARIATQPAKQYGWQALRPHAVHATGNQRINSFGIGGEVEVRAGLLTQKLPIAAPVVHFGLGENRQTDVARIVWPNGVAQAEFALPSNQAVVATQRLKGSCPWVFAWNGKRMAFVTDFLWRSPLGLRINAQDTGPVAMTRDWVRIRGDQLQPRDGFYDVRVTAELWETHFFDYMALMTVDHPAGTEMYVDERFAIPPPKLGYTLTGPSRPFARALDDRGQDVSATVRDLDAQYLDTFGRGRYQGITRDHWVELELPADAPGSGPLWLIAQGWIHPTDSSINVAISQGKHDEPRGLSLEVPDASGHWVTVRPNLGFPAGKTKTILVDLDGVFRPGAPRRLRLRTNLEMYWDRLAWAPGAPGAAAKTITALPTTAELRYRGYSAVSTANASSPELPDYDTIDGTGPRWRDLVGYCTRFGDVKPLLAKVDDRYVIMNAGDEMALRFPVTQPPPAGWVRDFVLIGDGWEKDGDFNTGYSRTVLPLPSHANPRYDRPPGRLEDDPVYRAHASDWRTYHTRYVTPDAFKDALRPEMEQSGQ